MTLIFPELGGWSLILLYFAVLFAAAKPLGKYIAAVYADDDRSPFRPLRGAEYFCGKLCGIDTHKEMSWREYTGAVLAFCFFGFLILYVLLLVQGHLPLNPQGYQGLTPDLAFNVAASFVTNTNWQSYSGEASLSHFSQTVGLTVQNFASAACGMAVMAALTRGIVRQTTQGIGNFWADLFRGAVYVLAPLSVIWSIALGALGVPQSFDAAFSATLAEPQPSAAGAVTEQRIALAPAASQTAIKQLGTNGGGVFNANSAHPFENPTAVSNFLEMLAILLLPAALCFSFGEMVSDKRQGSALLKTMTLIFVPLTLLCVLAELQSNGGLLGLAADGVLPGNWEGKELRFGVVSSALWSAATTAASNGSVNSMIDSYTPGGGLVPLVLIHLGEIIFGGVGSGVYGMMVYVVITVFVAGLMVGRTPEYMGKKIQVFEMKMAALAVLIPSGCALIAAGLAATTEAGRAGVFNPGAQGFSEILYAASSAAMNNGSAMGGLSANTPFYNVLLGVCMLFGRFWVIVPALALAGSLAAKKATPPSAGSLPTHNGLFIGMLTGVIVLVGLLTFLPALALGPLAELFR